MTSILKADQTAVGMTIKVNGRETTLTVKDHGPLSINDYILQAEVSGRFIVVVNDVLVHKSDYDSVMINDGDALDIVSPITGG